jgi:hypothetical protein
VQQSRESSHFQFIKDTGSNAFVSALKNDHAVVIEDTLQQKVNSPPTTTLSAFFDLCQKDEFSKLYCDPLKYNTCDVLQ